MWVLLWFPRMTLGWLFRPLHDWFNVLEADVEFLVKAFNQANPK